MTKAAFASTLTQKEERLIYILQLLGDKTRFKIFKLIADNQDMCVSEIASELHISVSAVSQHFRSFEMLGLVRKHRTGQKICYELKEDDTVIQELIAITKEQ